MVYSILNLGALEKADDNLIQIPKHFTSKVIAKSNHPIILNNGKKTKYIWHHAPDGGAIFDVNDGYIYVSNSEITNNRGGVGAIKFSKDGVILDAYPICVNTTFNCGGGKTPWNTWLTCEEYYGGHVWECYPLDKEKKPIRRDLLGTFVHEAVAVDPQTGHIYLTEDQSDGLLYRFVSEENTEIVDENKRYLKPNFNKGKLEALKLKRDATVEWVEIKYPNPKNSQKSTKIQGQEKGAFTFNGSEGIVFDDKKRILYFTAKGDNIVWMLNLIDNRLDQLYNKNTDPKPLANGLDNITLTSNGVVVIAEDGGNMEIVAISKDKNIPILRLEGHTSSEIAGIAFTSDMKKLYFSSQRGLRGINSDGITYEISGNFETIQEKNANIINSEKKPSIVRSMRINYNTVFLKLRNL
jgi:uncharacterized protein